MGQLCNALPAKKIDECENVISWSWGRSDSRDLTIISEQVEVCKFSSIIVWLASKNQLNNNSNHDFIVSPTLYGWVNTDSFQADYSIVLQFEKKKTNFKLSKFSKTNLMGKLSFQNFYSN